MLSVTTLSFDIFGLEIWLPLVTGAKVVIAPEEVARDGKKLAALMRRSGATVMQATPYAWRLLLESGWEGNANLKILCGGEAWPEELAAQLLPKCASLWNMYGPTETTIWSAVYAVEKGAAGLDRASYREYTILCGGFASAARADWSSGGVIDRWRRAGAWLFESSRVDSRKIHCRSLHD